MLKFAFEKKKKYFFKTCSLIWLVGGKVLLFVYILISCQNSSKCFEREKIFKKNFFFDMASTLGKVSLFVYM
jgi:hypothetical protein